MTIGSLPPGTRFRLPDAGLTGTLLDLGESGAVVQYDGITVKDFISPRTGKHVHFTYPTRPAWVISAGTVVEVVAGREEA